MAPPEDEFQALVEALAQQMRMSLNLSGSDPADVLRRGRYRLSRKLRRELDAMLDALARSSNPKLARQVDVARTRKTVEAATAQLKRVNLAKERNLRRYGIATSIAVNLAILVAGLAVLMVWLGVM